MKRMLRPCSILALLLALAAPGAAQERDREWFERQVGAIASSTDVARCERVLELWAWRLERGAAGARACADAWTLDDVTPGAATLQVVVRPWLDDPPRALRPVEVEVVAGRASEVRVDLADR